MNAAADGLPASPLELLRVDQILSQIAKDLEIDFQLRGNDMPRPEAMKHFQHRQALSIVRVLVIDKSEKLLSPT